MVIDMLIICEGNTDQTLLGSYIEDISDWEYLKIIENNPFPKEKTINWYSKGENHYLGIWDNGGDDFSRTINNICIRELREHIIDMVVFVTDNDDATASTSRPALIYDSLKRGLNGKFSTEKIIVNGWNEISWTSGFESVSCKVGYLLVPIDGNGALETYMLHAVAENKAENEVVVEKSIQFIDEFQSNNYLLMRRERTKAKLGVVLSILAPDKSFRIMKEIIDSIDWKQYSITNEQFKMITNNL